MDELRQTAAHSGRSALRENLRAAGFNEGVRHELPIKRRLSELSKHDADRYYQFLEDMDPEAGVVGWLKQGFIATAMPRDYVLRLDSLLNKWDRDPRNYQDEELAKKFDDLRESIRAFQDHAVTNMFSKYDSYRYEVPSEWKDTRPAEYARIVDNLHEACDLIVARYDSFLKAASSKQLQRHWV